jgi:hypothetical protein
MGAASWLANTLPGLGQKLSPQRLFVPELSLDLGIANACPFLKRLIAAEFILLPAFGLRRSLTFTSTNSSIC